MLADKALDKTATNTVATQHATNGHAGNFTKKLLPGSKELERVSLLAGHIRKYFYQETLPWFSDGARIIKAESYLQFMAEFGKMKSDFDSAVCAFLSAYPYLQAHAQNSLGSLYCPTEYPDVSILNQKFQCEVHISPLPDARDFRVDVSEDVKRALIERNESVQREAMAECWARLYEVVQKAAERLATPDAIFKDSLLENVSEMCSILPRLNITDDATLEAKRMEVEATIASMSPEKLRDSATDRQDAAARLAEITKSMGAYMGVPDANIGVIKARLSGAKFEGSPGANLVDGIIINTGTES